MDPQETRNDIEKTFGSIPGFFNTVPQNLLTQMWQVMKPYLLGQASIPPKYREMIGLGVAAALKCPQCETFHNAAARLYGATESELAEVRAIISQVSFWSSVQHTLDHDMDSMMKEFQAMGERFARQQTDSKT